jgi:hypothetical protein
MVRYVVVALFVFFVGCAPAQRTASPSVVAPCDEVYGACVLYGADAPYPIPHERLVQAFELAAKHWGEKPEAIRGWTVVVHGYAPMNLYGTDVWGITLPELKRLDFVYKHPTCPEPVFIHEFGHAASLARGEDGRPHDEFSVMLNYDDEPRFKDSNIVQTLKGVPGC